MSSLTVTNLAYPMIERRKRKYIVSLGDEIFFLNERYEMRKLLVCFLSLVLGINLFSAIKKTGWEIDGLKGRVKERLTIDYVIRNKAGEDVKEIQSKSIVRYDPKGNKLERVTYDAKGTLIGKDIFKYDDSNKIEEAQYNGSGVLREKTVFKYDDNGNMIELAVYNEKGILTKIGTFSYTYY
jgi:hypothetical protein